jgi:hypothetical protein
VSSSVFVVQEETTGRWIAGCCDERCEDLPGCFGEGMHTLAEEPTKAAADRVATRHRKLLATIPDPCKPKAGECEACGQSRTVIRELQDLVRPLEARLIKE